MDPQTIAAVCDAFALGAPSGEPSPVAGGLTNRMWRLETDRGVFAIKEMNRDFGRADYISWFDRAFTLEQSAWADRIPMPRPVPAAATGRCLAELPDGGDRPITVRVHEWVDGVKLDQAVYPVDVIERIGGMLGRIHALGMRSDESAAYALNQFGDEHWAQCAERVERADIEWAWEFRRLLPVLAQLEAYVASALADPTPFILSHRDSDPKNYMRTPDGELVLADWDAAGPVNPRHDLANHALVWAGVHLGEPSPQHARAYVDAYRRSGGVDEPFRDSDLAELVGNRLGWFHFNLRRALGERARDAADREAGAGVIRRNFTQLPRFVASLPRWLSVLSD